MLQLALALLSMALVGIASQQSPAPAPDCCTPDTEKLSPQQVKSLLQKTEPIQSPPFANQLRLSGTVVLAIAVDASGNVTCIHRVTGHPLIIGSVIESVSRWKFRPHVEEKRPRSFCGKIAVRFQGSEGGVDYQVVEAPSE
jgi:outer membrane biosynthesis protein TonB